MIVRTWGTCTARWNHRVTLLLLLCGFVNLQLAGAGRVRRNEPVCIQRADSGSPGHKVGREGDLPAPGNRQNALIGSQSVRIFSDLAHACSHAVDGQPVRLLKCKGRGDGCH